MVLSPEGQLSQEAVKEQPAPRRKYR